MHKWNLKAYNVSRSLLSKDFNIKINSKNNFLKVSES